MPRLQILEASFNNFTDARFDAVPCSMQSLFLFKNNIIGDLPQLGSLGACSMELRLLDIRNNSLSGPLPQDLPPNLGILKISNNAFTGTLPSSWSKLPMADLQLDKNQLTGKLPPSWSAWAPGRQHRQLHTTVHQRYTPSWRHAKGMGPTVLSCDF